MKLVFDHEKQLMHSSPTGPISAEMIISHYDQLIENTQLPRVLQVFIDCTNTKFAIRPEEVSNINKKVGEACKHYDRIDEVIVVDQPYSTAVARVFEGEMQYPNYSFNVFCTHEAAGAWLKQIKDA